MYGLTNNIHSGPILRQVIQQRVILFSVRADQPILLIDKNGLIDCNEETAKMLGCKDRQQVLDCKHIAIFSPDTQADGTLSVEHFVQMAQIAYETGVHRFDWLQKKLDGEIERFKVLQSRLDGTNHSIATVFQTTLLP